MIMPHNRIEEYLCHYSCPVEATLDVIGGKWKGVIIYHLLEKDVMRYNEIRREIKDAPRRTITRQLRELEQAGLIQREVYPEVPPKVEYSLTPFGKTLGPIIKLMRDWGSEHIEEIVAYRGFDRDDTCSTDDAEVEQAEVNTHDG
jgi:DNA-binding HxlR family transcriptional regulator